MFHDFTSQNGEYLPVECPFTNASRACWVRIACFISFCFGLITILSNQTKGIVLGQIPTIRTKSDDSLTVVQPVRFRQGRMESSDCSIVTGVDLLFRGSDPLFGFLVIEYLSPSMSPSARLPPYHRASSMKFIRELPIRPLVGSRKSIDFSPYTKNQSLKRHPNHRCP